MKFEDDTGERIDCLVKELRMRLWLSSSFTIHAVPGLASSLCLIRFTSPPFTG